MGVQLPKPTEANLRKGGNEIPLELRAEEGLRYV